MSRNEFLDKVPGQEKKRGTNVKGNIYLMYRIHSVIYKDFKHHEKQVPAAQQNVSSPTLTSQTKGSTLEQTPGGKHEGTGTHPGSGNHTTESRSLPEHSKDLREQGGEGTRTVDVSSTKESNNGKQSVQLPRSNGERFSDHRVTENTNTQTKEPQEQASLFGERDTQSSSSTVKPEKKKEPQKQAHSAVNSEVLSTEEAFNEKYNKGFAPLEIAVWKKAKTEAKSSRPRVTSAVSKDKKYTLQDNSLCQYENEKEQGDKAVIYTDTLSDEERKYIRTSGAFIKIASDAYMHEAIYASGNIYARLEELEENKATILAEEGAAGYNRRLDLLSKALPKQKSIKDITVSPNTNFAQEMHITNADDPENPEKTNLHTMFLRWLYYGAEEDVNLFRTDVEVPRDSESNSPVLPEELKEGVTFQNIKSYLDGGKPIDKKLVSDLKETTERLYNKFLKEGLPKEVQDMVVHHWNRRFNGTVSPDYTKIPLSVEGISKQFKDKDLTISDIQCKGVKELLLRGFGLLAFDVGVGKTITGIIATVKHMQAGKTKRPLICVPKSVYQNWISEIKQLFPTITINELGNFGKGVGPIAEGTLSVCTYEALQKITFSDDELEALGHRLLETEPHTITSIEKRKDKTAGYGNGFDESIGAYVMRQELRKKLNDKDGKEKGGIGWGTLGFDHVTIDEVHNFKSLHDSVEAKSEISYVNATRKKANRKANEFSGLSAGSLSNRALKMFLVAESIRAAHNGENVFALSATPFTNSPIEIYSILSLVSRETLKSFGIHSLYDFMAHFSNIKDEQAVKANGDIDIRPVMKEFKNLPVLQNLIKSCIDRVDGEEAGVIRPKKFTHKVALELSELQKSILKIERERLGSKEPGGTLKAINNMRQALMSPVLLAEGYKEEGISLLEELKPEEFVSASPKLTFVCDSVAQSYAESKQKNTDGQANGQVIYVPTGVKHYDQIREYLISKGVPKKAIAYLKSGMTDDAKEAIMSDFNRKEGTIKVIMGSETIKEGVNLNGNTMALYNAGLDWNFTDIQQVEGRIHRQGNEQGHVHIVYPFMLDSVDGLILQKFDEKKSRLDNIWDCKDDSLKVETINPEELKFDLITDPGVLATLFREEATKDISMEFFNVKSRLKKLKSISEIIYKNQLSIESYQEEIDSRTQEAKEDYNLFDDDIEKQLEILRKEKSTSDAYYKFIKKHNIDIWSETYNIPQKLRNEYKKLQDDKDAAYRAFSNVKYPVKRIFNNEGYIKEFQETIRKNIVKIQKMGYEKCTDVESLNTLQTKFSDRYAELKTTLDTMDKNKEEYYKKAEEKIAERKKNRGEAQDIPRAIKTNVQAIMGNLRTMEAVKAEIEAERNQALKKALFFIANNRIYMRRLKKAYW
jgi:ribosomal protein S8